MSPQFPVRRPVFFRHALAIGLLTLLLAACGNKGDLVKPSAPAEPAKAASLGG